MKNLLAFFKRENVEEGKNNFWLGLIIGIIATAIILAVVYGIFNGFSWFKKEGKTTNADPAKLRITIITKKDCADCFDINLLLDAINQSNVKIIGTETTYVGDKEADSLIKKYNITRVPTVIIGGDLNKNEDLQAMWESLGEIVDGAFVFRQVIPPYIDLSTGELRGKASVIFLGDKSCSSCYDVKLHDNALKNLGIFIKDQKEVDIADAEGKELVKKYNITVAPTIILQGDLEAYTSLGQMWSEYGEVADDGSYIFTNLSVMGSYKDLSTGRVITPEATQ